MKIYSCVLAVGKFGHNRTKVNNIGNCSDFINNNNNNNNNIIIIINIIIVIVKRSKQEFSAFPTVP